MKKTNVLWLLLISISSTAGLIFYLAQHHILIIHWSATPNAQLIQELQRNTVMRKKVFMYFCKTTTFERTPIEILWTRDNHQENLNNLVGNWITQLQDEKLISHYVTLKSAAYSPISREGIISFSQSPFEPNWSIQQKWYCLESLCLSIREAEIPTTSLIFLVNNHPMEDEHLDLSHPWPLDGFINSLQ